ncbi:hypothetical protein GCM10023081_08530 [Arthrobacter ginkgonis]|uniref:7-cyano-7-deazaguanine synthase n=1 Tax=Arthrobacter ginkgonis TaxID=1630594 RepID=A0ABP7C0D0_9MICC
MSTAHIYVDDTKATEGIRTATIEVPDRETRTLFFESHEGILSVEAGADPFLLGSLLLLMEAGHAVHVHGEVTQRLLRNLHELQAAWAKWKPEKYVLVEISADSVVDRRPSSTAAISAFSGGVDASYTVQMNLRGRPNASHDLRAVVFVHGFDIPLENESDYLGARDRGEKLLAGTGLKTLGLRTNVRSLGQDWEDSFGLAVASCLTAYQGEYGVGLIGSGHAYDDIVLGWGSSPVTDHLYGTGQMDIWHDGAGAARTDKMASLASWPEALQYLRVCWQGKRGDRNCGRCEKCVRTFLNFKAVGVDSFECFEQVPDRQAVRRLRVGSSAQLGELKSIARYAARHGVSGEWTSDLAYAIRVNSLRVAAKQNALISATVRAVRRK